MRRVEIRENNTNKIFSGKLISAQTNLVEISILFQFVSRKCISDFELIARVNMAQGQTNFAESTPVFTLKLLK